MDDLDYKINNGLTETQVDYVEQVDSSVQQMWFSFQAQREKFLSARSRAGEMGKGLITKNKGSETDNNRLIEEISKTKPRSDWKTYTPDKQYGVVITLPHENSISGTLTYGDNSEGQMYIDMFKVSDKLQGHGLGTRLLRSLTAEAKIYGANTLNGHFTSESALRTEAKVFGKDNLRFYNHATGEKLNITYEQALKDNPDVNVVVDIKNIDTSDWELPVKSDSRTNS